MKDNEKDVVSSDSKNKKVLTEKQKKKIWDKYTKHFKSFLNGSYTTKNCGCVEGEDCDCTNQESA